MKKVKDESYDAKARCFKGATLLNNGKEHINIVKFLGFCDEPRAIMMNMLVSTFGNLVLKTASAL